MGPEGYRPLYCRSITDREGFWSEQAEAITWHRRGDQVLDYSRPPFADGSRGGRPISATTPWTATCGGPQKGAGRHLDGDRARRSVSPTRTVRGGKPLRRRPGSTSASPRATALILYLPMMPKPFLPCWLARGWARSTRWSSAGLPPIASPSASRMPAEALITADAGMRGGKSCLTNPWWTRPCGFAAAGPDGF